MKQRAAKPIDVAARSTRRKRDAGSATATLGDTTGSQATDPALETLARRLANGDDIDWETASGQAKASNPALAGLSVLDRISRLARSERRALTDMTRRPRDSAGGPHASQGQAAATLLPGPSGAMVDPTALTTWGSLQLIEKIGEGSYGEVFRAHDPALRVDVALKLWFTRWSLISDMDEFLLEARTQARIRHPNVLAVLGAARHADRVGMWTELLRGETLEAALAAHGFFGPGEAALIGAELCRALAAVHGAGLIHGDLKTRNVMRVQGGRIVLMDFGSVTEAGQFGASDRDTFLSGTPLTMAPELLHGGAADPTTDLYSLGVLLYRLVSGHYPIEAGNLEELIARHDRGERVPLRDRRPDLDGEFIEMVERALSADTPRRFASAGAFEQALLRYVRAEAPTSAPESPRESAAPPAPDAPRSLHAYLTRFIGREREVSHCLELLEGARLLTLTGVAGCGKTRLGLRIAEGQVGRIARGVWFVDLAPLNEPGRVAQTVAQAVGAGEERGKTLLESAGSHVGAEPALIVLDNCEHVLGAAAAAAVALLQQCPRLKIIATSREALGLPGETVFQVPSLSLPEPGVQTVLAIADSEAVRLFMSCAALARPDFRLTDENASAVSEICRRLDGIPLAIELAAARLKVLGPAEILAKLDDRFRLLTGGSRWALPRHQTLRETLRWSYDLLSNEERGLLRSLAVFAGGWTIDAAQRVCAEASDGFEVLDLMSNLVDKSLVVVEHTARGRSRYRLLETVRQFALEKLSEAPEAGTIRDRHLECFTDYAVKHGPERGNEQAAGLAACDVEHENFLAALAWAEESEGGSRQALKIVAALYTYWISRARFTLGADHVAKALARPGLDSVTSERATANFAGSVLAFYREDPASRAYAEKSLDLFRALDEKKGIAAALNAIANAQLDGGDVDVIRAIYQDSLAAAREVGHKPSIAIALNNLANLAAEANDSTAALPLYQESVEIHRAQGKTASLGLSLANLAETLVRLGRPEEAKPSLIESLKISRETRRQDYGAHAMTITGLVAERSAARLVATRLLGAADLVRQATGVPLQPVELEFHQAAIARLREALGDEAWGRAWAEGCGLSFEAAVDQTLAWLEDPASAEGAERAAGGAESRPERRRQRRGAATPWP